MSLKPDAIVKHLHSLLDLPVKGKPAKSMDLKGPAVVGLVDDEEGNLCSIIHFSVAAAGGVAGALSRIPPMAVQDAVKKGNLDEGLQANFYEVANVLTVLTTQEAGRRTILRSVEYPPAAEATAKTFLRTAGVKAYGTIEVPGYPGGVMGIAFPKG